MAIFNRLAASFFSFGVVATSVLAIAITSGEAATISGEGENEATIYQLNEVSCQQSYSNNELVMLETGAIQPVQDYCEGPSILGSDRSRQPEIRRPEVSPWSATYWEGDTVCRSRNGGDVVCVTPRTADELDWVMPQ